MIKSLTLAALVASSFAGTALAAHRRAPVDAASYYDSYDRPAAPTAAPTQEPHADYGSFGAGPTARNHGY